MKKIPLGVMGFFIGVSLFLPRLVSATPISVCEIIRRNPFLGPFYYNRHLLAILRDVMVVESLLLILLVIIGTLIFVTYKNSKIVGGSLIAFLSGTFVVQFVITSIAWFSWYMMSIRTGVNIWPFIGLLQATPVRDREGLVVWFVLVLLAALIWMAVVVSRFYANKVLGTEAKLVSKYSSTAAWVVILSLIVVSSASYFREKAAYRHYVDTTCPIHVNQ